MIDLLPWLNVPEYPWPPYFSTESVSIGSTYGTALG